MTRPINVQCFQLSLEQNYLLTAHGRLKIAIYYVTEY